ncbi:hypothetical protein LF845_09290 [Deferribacterales bacterium Es71-Z0220]|jgi:hypothetical protein|uniref:hypothetical protein n=1 Tax=Deferrivibrio essentukiensis TaxID=2880922 RepID=UPI001F609BF3|nr:hypothetical protein [Deferrivibrio essentukiensis]MBZ4672420.1 hypothetical protein [Deferribacteraceae bacterium]MCB4205151.1 hypothetical protein [Deferrivibrio essentukiensis]
MKKIIIIALIVQLFYGCMKNVNNANYSDIVFNPQNSFSRELKAKYTNELNQIAQKLSEYGLKVQQDGLGFTKGSTCKDCIYDEGDFWMFISLEHASVDANKNINIKIRGINVAQKVVKDTFFALKDIDLNKLLAEKSFKGFLISGTYGIYKSINERIKPKDFETVDVYIPKITLIQYKNNTLSLNEILNYSQGYAAKFGSKNYEKIF